MVELGPTCLDLIGAIPPLVAIVYALWATSVFARLAMQDESEREPGEITPEEDLCRLVDGYALDALAQIEQRANRWQL